MIRRTLVILAALSASLANAQIADQGPEPVIRSLVRAMYAADSKSFEKLALPEPGISVLTRGGTVNRDGLRELDEDPTGVQIIKKRGFEYRGVAAHPDATGKFPIGTTVVYVVAHHRSPMVMIAQMTAESWKIDPRWWIGMVQLATTAGPVEGTPEFAARRLIAAMIAGDKEEARRRATPDANMELLFSGAPSQREPSGVLDAAAVEMPVVELKPGEFRRLPTGQIVEGSAEADRKALVGLFGSVEIPFVVRKIGNAWRVEPQPYFMLIES